MNAQSRLRIAIQKSGRLNNDCMNLLSQCGLKIRLTPKTLYAHCENLPIDILLVRDDDIPTLIISNVCDLGIIGENVLYEQLSDNNEQKNYCCVKKLGFSQCRLSIALPKEKNFNSLQDLNGCQIATSYPNLLKNYLNKNNITARIIPISGSVEVAPRLGMADAICDLVSTGATLSENNLKEVDVVLQSQAVLIKTKSNFNLEKQAIFELLKRRIDGVLKAQDSKYIMFHAPKESLEAIKSILPGCETPTIMTLEGVDDKVAVHVVSTEGIFWNTLEKLKQAGANSILVLPIEKMME